MITQRLKPVPKRDETLQTTKGRQLFPFLQSGEIAAIDVGRHALVGGACSLSITASIAELPIDFSEGKRPVGMTAEFPWRCSRKAETAAEDALFYSQLAICNPAITMCRRRTP